MKSALKDKRVFITGGALRIGSMIVKRLAAEGVKVIFTFNQSSVAASELLKKIGGAKAGHKAIRLDLSKKIPAYIFKEYAQIDFLINNASVFFPKRIICENETEIERQIKINFLAPLLLSKLFAEQCSKGAIVNLLDCRVENLERADGSYWLSKKALQNATKLLAVQLAPKIRVNAVAPGAMLAPTGSVDFSAEKAAAAAPLKKMPKVPDLLDAIVFLLKNESITGQTIYVDAGRHLLWAGER